MLDSCSRPALRQFPSLLFAGAHSLIMAGLVALEYPVISLQRVGPAPVCVRPDKAICLARGSRWSSKGS